MWDSSVCKQKQAAQHKFAKSQTKPRPGERGRWVAVVGLTGFLLFSDVFMLGKGSHRLGNWLADGMTSNWAAVLTLLLSGALLLMTQSASPRKNRGVDPPSAQTDRQRQRDGICDTLAPTDREVESSHSQTRPSQPKTDDEKASQLTETIALAVRGGDGDRAERLLIEFEGAGGQPEAASYTWVMRACVKRGNVSAAEKWFQHMQSKGLKPTIYTYNALLDACARGDNVNTCEKWLKRMLEDGIEPNVFSYATTINASAKRGDVGAAELWFKKMVDAGIQPDDVSYISLIHACGVKGALERAEYWVKDMESRGVTSTAENFTVVYTAVIDACAKRGDVDRAEGWFARMIEKGLEPNIVTFGSMIDACAKAGSLARAEAWYGRVVARGIAPSAHNYSAMINACAKEGGPGCAAAAETWLDRAEQAGVLQDKVLYCAVVNAYVRIHDVEGALRIFNRMVSSGVKPGIVAYSTIARAFAQRGDWRKVEGFAADMARGGVAVNDFFLYAQLLSYTVSQEKQPDRAEACFRSAIHAGVELNGRVAHMLSRAVGKARSEKLIQELCPGFEGPLVRQLERDTRAHWHGGKQRF